MLLNLPNVITAMRILLVIPIAWLLWNNRHMDAFVLMVVAAISDALDGLLARRFSWTSDLGAILDPLADKLLVASVFVVFTLQGHIPLWVALIVLFRDFTILVGALVYKALYEQVEIAPTFVSKVNTATQMVVLCLILLELLALGVVSELANAIVDPFSFYVLALLGLSSGIDYVFTWGSKAYRRGRQRKAYKRGPTSLRRPE